jgi:hypothetical protein
MSEKKAELIFKILNFTCLLLFIAFLTIPSYHYTDRDLDPVTGILTLFGLIVVFQEMDLFSLTFFSFSTIFFVLGFIFLNFKQKAGPIFSMISIILVIPFFVHSTFNLISGLLDHPIKYYPMIGSYIFISATVLININSYLFRKKIKPVFRRDHNDPLK